MTKRLRSIPEVSMSYETVRGPMAPLLLAPAEGWVALQAVLGSHIFVLQMIHI